MLILLSCAKTMSERSTVVPSLVTDPRFYTEAQDIAFQMSQFTVGELEQLLQVNAKIAVENYKRFQSFHAPGTVKIPAVLAYSGIVFKRLDPKSFSPDDYRYAQDHLRLTSFCYGLLRPLDRIAPYRLEGSVHLPEQGDENLFAYWRSRLTDLFIAEIKAAGGVLCYLASDEMRGLFDWSRVEREVRVVVPEFQTWKNGRLKTIVVYTKMCRGEMSRFILKQRIERVEELKTFEWEGFVFNPALSDDKRLLFTQG